MPDEHGKITFGWLKLENVPTWVLVLVVLLCAAGAGFWLYQRSMHPEFELVTLKQANAAMQAAVNEYNVHFNEKPETSAVLMDDARGKYIAVKYQDDCLVISQTTREGKVKSKLIVSLARDEHEKMTSSAWAPSVVLHAAEPCVRCPNHTDKPARVWYGERRGEWVEVWREWADSCRHRQWFDAQHGLWAMNPDGTPAFCWVRCIH